MARVLVVEDDESLRDYFRFVLENSGHRVDAVGDGQTALDVCRQTLPDLVFLDVMIPEVNGYEVCHRLKSDDKTKGIKVVMVTAKGFSADRQQAKDVGADGYLAKPVSPLEMVEVVKTVLPPPPTAEGPTAAPK